MLAEIQLRRKNYDAVRSLADEFRRFDPKSRFGYQSTEVLARTWKNQARPDFAKARELFQQVIDDPHGRRTPTAAKAQFLIGETWLFEKQHKQALDAFERVFSLYNLPEWAAPAMLQAARCEEALSRTSQARATYLELIDKFPAAKYAESAKKRLNGAASGS